MLPWSDRLKILILCCLCSQNFPCLVYTHCNYEIQIKKKPIYSKESILPVRISVWIKSKRSDTYCIAEIISVPTQIVSLRPRIFRPKKKLSVFLQKNLKPIQKVLLRSESFWINRNVPLCLRQFMDQIKLLCFVPEMLGQNEIDLLSITNLLN